MGHKPIASPTLLSHPRTQLLSVQEVGLAKAAETLSDVAASVRSFNALCSDWEKDEIAMLKEDFSSPADREKVRALASVN